MIKVKYWLQHFLFGFKYPEYLDVYATELFDMYYGNGNLVFEADYFSHYLIVYYGSLRGMITPRSLVQTIYVPFRYKGVLLKFKA